MIRLRDESWFDPISEKGIETLRSVLPTASSSELKRRLWVALQETPVAPPFQRRSIVLKAVVVALGLSALTATAAATISGRRSGGRIDRFLGAVRRAWPSRSDQIKPVRIGVDAETSPSQTSRRPSATATPASAGGQAPPGGGGAPLPAPGGPQSWHVAPPAAGTSRERTQVWEALVALRRDYDPNRAVALLNQDLKSNAQGALRQEALVLAIEAADARGDRRGAERFARTYRREFPSGRFSKVAQGYLNERTARLSSLPSRQ